MVGVVERIVAAVVAEPARSGMQMVQQIILVQLLELTARNIL
jgi:hypothetical protein